MKHTPKDGGPAFPRDSYKDNETGLLVQQNGMTLRDWFAGQALPELILAYTQAYGSPTSAPDEIVTEAYHFADAMLAKRKRRQ